MPATYSVFQGWNIIPVPSSPAPKQVVFSSSDTVGMVQSPFTMASQFQTWPGADYWNLEVSLPPMTRKSAAIWIAWLQALRGKANIFQFGDPLGKTPQGTPQGTPIVNGLQLASSTVLNTRGWTANATNLLLPGDYIGLGYRMYQVAGPVAVDADASGNASIEIWPSLREAVADGNAIQTENCEAVFRLTDNKRDWTVMETGITTIAFKAVEAR